jgi:carboxymethylenebutenolidase
MAGADASITPELVAEFDAALTAASVPHEVITYPGAPHSFFDRRYEEFASASQDAWQRTLAFVEQA